MVTEFSKPEWTTSALARFVDRIQVEDLPESVLEKAADCVLDLMAAEVGGFHTPAGRAARRFGSSFFPPGPAGVWFEGATSSPAGAAMMNAATACALDIDDGHRAAGGHPGAAIIPASLAEAQLAGVDGRRFLAAVVIGYEIAVRVSAARDMAALETFATGRWCGYGAAAAAGWLRGTDPKILAHGLALAGIHAPIQSASAYSRLGHNAKEGIPWGVLSGLAGLDLAQSGFSGPLDILDNEAYFDAGRILEGLGREWAIEQVYFKPYSLCRWIHSAVEALTGLMSDYRVPVGAIERVEVHTFRRALNLNNETSPTTIEAAQYSLPFGLAVAAHEGPAALLPLEENLLARSDLVNWAQRVSLHLDDQAEAAFPARTIARVAVHSAGNVLDRLVEHPHGDPANPFNRQDLEEKFSSVAGKYMSDRAAGELLRAVRGLVTGDLAPLIHCLAGELKPGRTRTVLSGSKGKTRNSDVVVIGAGIVGASTAWRLAQRGLSVTLIDKSRVGGEASGRNGGGVRQQYRDSRETQMAMAAIGIWTGLCEELGQDVEYSQEGCIRLIRSGQEEREARERVKAERALGLEVHFLDPDQTRQRLPLLSRELEILGSTYCPSDGTANPLLVTRAIGQAAARAGAVVRTGEPVLSLKVKGGRVVAATTSRAEYQAAYFVNAAGPWARELCRTVDLEIPTSLRKSQLIITERLSPLLSGFVSFDNGYLRQARDGNIHLGVRGTPIQDKDTSLTTDALSDVGRFFPEVFPFLINVHIIRGFAGITTWSPDLVPIIDTNPGLENLLLATGFSGHGFCLGPVVGRLFTEWITESRTSLDLSDFALSRFSEAGCAARRDVKHD